MFELNHIYCGECASIMDTFPENTIDMCITSPPYDDIREYKGYFFDINRIAKSLYRVMKPGAVLIWVVNDKTDKSGGKTLTSFTHALTFKSVGFSIIPMIYHKSGIAYPSLHDYNEDFEYMFKCVKGKSPRVFNPIMDRKNKWAGHSNWGDITSRKKDGELKLVKRKEENTYVIPDYGKRGRVWTYATGKGNSTRDKIAFKHPAIFPERLAEDHIKSWTNMGDIVLDPMCGSGTTLKIAKLLNRNYIGIDTSQEYVDISEKRINCPSSY